MAQMKCVLWTLALFCAWAAGQEEPREVPIIKQINRVNDDGTYTFGYEAADGSFKIETRDVLGNVKGMFGYIDEQGQLKRVSYTANNGTGFQSTGTFPDASEPIVTRRPVLVYRGVSRPVTERSEPDGGSTTANYGDYLNGRRGYVSSTTEEPTTKPVRVMVTKRPIEGHRNLNVIRRQLDRDRDDYSSRRFRYQTPVDSREAYRNQLLEQSNLKPDYPPSRPKYYPQVEEDYPEVPMDRATPAPRYAPLPPRYRPFEDQQYSGFADPRRLPSRPVPRPYDDYLGPPPDYEAFRAAMNYLLQYLQYMRRMDPYTNYPYPSDPYNPRPRLPFYPQPRFPPVPQALPVPAPFSAANIPYINPNVQYSTGQGNAQEALANLKTRMDHADPSDSGDHRPPTSSLIKMLLARPNVTQRPAIRSVEILGTAKSTTSTTTESTDVMEPSS